MTKDDVQKQFSKSADLYVKSEGHAKGKDLKKLAEIANVTKKDEVLDVAAGGGHVANAIAPLAKKVTAFDLTEEMLQAARHFIIGNGLNNVAFVRGDAEKMPFATEMFHIVTCRIAPHHFSDVERFVAETYRVLKHGGRFLLIDNVSPEDDDFDKFYNEVEKRRDYSHHRAWKKSEWMKMLERQGFDIQESYRFTKTFMFDSWCQRMNLSEKEKQYLTEFMLKAPQKMHQKFRIETENNRVVSFQGESVLIRAEKPENYF
jgi:ubiquinone/menaquinone biosynthesis C-methylase UbiE